MDGATLEVQFEKATSTKRYEHAGLWSTVVTTTKVTVPQQPLVQCFDQLRCAVHEKDIARATKLLNSIISAGGYSNPVVYKNIEALCSPIGHEPIMKLFHERLQTVHMLRADEPRLKTLTNEEKYAILLLRMMSSGQKTIADMREKQKRYFELTNNLLLSPLSTSGWEEYVREHGRLAYERCCKQHTYIKRLQQPMWE